MRKKSPWVSDHFHWGGSKPASHRSLSTLRRPCRPCGILILGYQGPVTRWVSGAPCTMARGHNTSPGVQHMLRAACEEHTYPWTDKKWLHGDPQQSDNGSSLLPHIYPSLMCGRSSTSVSSLLGGPAALRPSGEGGGHQGWCVFSRRIQ